ncbi:hypothetical protein FJY71_01990, partial [candidate division WOR-3 bacterium]|nr:hypothetical protein [candidate division WOR-3 bacterium]
MKRLTAAGLAVLFFSAAALGGDTVWTRRYDGGFGDEEARAVLVDGSGNVIVVGSSAGGATARDYVVIKYSPNGAPLWTTRVAGQSGSYDDARAAAIDAAGAVYVTGSSGYFPNYNYMTAKVNSNGSEVWRAHYGSPGNGTDYAVAVAADSLGYSYVTGYVSDSAGGSNDIVTIKYNPDSSRSWVMIYDGGG